MDQPAALSPSPSPPSFAGLLASLTSPAPAVAASDAELADDVVTISYELALRNHSRSQPARLGDSLEPPSGNSDTTTAAIGARTGEAVAMPDSEPSASAGNRDLRTASITIRLSEAECARLRQRAAEAGLTVSAYLRSCVLEADALRAQVKQALAEIKAAAQAQSTSAPVRTPLFGWVRRRAKSTA